MASSIKQTANNSYLSLIIAKMHMVAKVIYTRQEEVLKFNICEFIEVTTMCNLRILATCITKVPGKVNNYIFSC